MNQKDVFISYKSEEFEEAEWVRAILEGEGISCWMAPMCIPGGSNYAGEIPKAIRECQVFVLILSKNAQESIWVPKELDQAINAGKKIMPFVIEDVELDDVFGFYLSNVQRYFAFAGRESVIRKMILDIKKELYHAAFLSDMIRMGTEENNLKKRAMLTKSFQFDRGYISEYMVTDCNERKAFLNSALILIVDGILNERQGLQLILDRAEQADSNLLIIAEEFSEDVITALIEKNVYGKKRVVAVKAPSYGERRQEILCDIAVLTGGKIISEEMNFHLENVTLYDLGCTEFVEVQNELTKITGGMGDENEILDRIEQIRRRISRTHSSFEKEKMQERITNLMEGSVKTGVESETEIVTRKFSNGIYAGNIKNEVPHGNGKMQYTTGDVYEGEWAEGYIHGYGKFTAVSGEQYAGEFRENIVHGQGTKLYANGAKYEGEWFEARRHGQGCFSMDGNVYNGVWREDQFIEGKVFIKYSDGSVYEGDWKNQKQNGAGIYYAQNGDIFDGEWEDHQFVSGKCLIKYKDGRVYQGGWSNGNYNGKGSMTLPDGSSYEGDWVDGKRWGEGKCCWPDGTVYEGHWANDTADGYGIRKKGSIQYEGQWKEGKRHGHGIFTFSNGDKHECEWVNGRPRGNGIYTYSDGAAHRGFFKEDILWSGEGTVRYENGDVYVGQIENGVYNGNGTLFKADGTKIMGQFEDGMAHGKAVYTDASGQQFSCKYNHGKLAPFSMKKI